MSDQDTQSTPDPDHPKQMAREFAAQAWCTPETSGIEMDVRLAEAFAQILENWLRTAAQMSRDCDYYRDLVRQIGRTIGKEAYVSDDGSVQDEVLCAKVPELVQHLVNVKCDCTTETSPDGSSRTFCGSDQMMRSIAPKDPDAQRPHLGYLPTASEGTSAS